MGGIRVKPPGVRQRFGDFRIWPHIQFKRMNYPTWPPPNASPLHPTAPPPDGLTPSVSRLAAAAAAAAEEAEAAAAAAAAGSSGVGWSEAAYASAAASKRASEAAATAAAAEIAAGPLVTAAAPVVCVADHMRRPLLFLSAADLSILKQNLSSLKAQLEEFRKTAKPSKVEELYALRRRLLPAKTTGMQRMKKGEHQSYGVKKGVARERKT